MIKPQTLKGFRDFLPQEAKKRQYVINTLKSVFESFGFEPLETPALEYEEILTGKYGDEGDKLMYRFEDNGGRRVALRYDQTVPLSRVVAQYQNELTFPFKRYQIQPVWRAENTQKGRFREFLQCDIDIVGSSSLMADAEIASCIISACKSLGFERFLLEINGRETFGDLSQSYIASVDKMKKIGEDGVVQELIEKGMDVDKAKKLIENLLFMPPSEHLKKLFAQLELVGLKESIDFEYSPSLARGLDYYTGSIFELVNENYGSSLGGGGRYDNLIGMFAGKQIPAVGFAFGFDRLLDAMEQLNLFPANLQTAKILVTIFNPAQKEKSLEISSRLRSNDINTELYLDENAKMDKQLKYANQKNIPFVVIIGPDEAAKGVVQLKNMQSREQKEVTIDQLISELR